MIAASRDLGHAGNAAHAHRGRGVSCGPVAELAVGVVSPALDGATGEESAGVSGAS